jgi:hypothetical protein
MKWLIAYMGSSLLTIDSENRQCAFGVNTYITVDALVPSERIQPSSSTGICYFGVKGNAIVL